MKNKLLLFLLLLGGAVCLATGLVVWSAASVTFIKRSAITPSSSASGSANIGDEEVLSSLEKESVLQARYPTAQLLDEAKSNTRNYPLEGYRAGPKIVLIFGIRDTQATVAEYYISEFEKGSWSKVTDTTFGADTDRKMIYNKGKLRAVLDFWKKDMFEMTYPDLKSASQDYPTIIRLAISSTAK